MKKQTKKPRKVLVILTNRFRRDRPPRHIELTCKSDGTILKERELSREPSKAQYDEVWSNDEGKSSIDTCTRMSRCYRHPLQLQKT